MCMTRILAAALALVLGAFTQVLAQEALSGTYEGVQEARGARIDIQPDGEGYTGTFYDAAGRSQRFEADKIGSTAHGVLDMDGGTVLLQVSPTRFGAEVILLPVTPQGEVEVARGRVEAFVRPGTILPEPPLGFLPAPLTQNTRITGNAFLTSYRLWGPAGVRNGYLALPDRVRTMMRFFPAVQLDVIHRLCQAPQPEGALAIALRGQGVSCPQVLKTLGRSGRKAEYEGEVESQLETLLSSIRCGEGYRESKRTCDNAARQVSQAALSLQTAANVLARYR